MGDGLVAANCLSVYVFGDQAPLSLLDLALWGTGRPCGRIHRELLELGKRYRAEGALSMTGPRVRRAKFRLSDFH